MEKKQEINIKKIIKLLFGYCNCPAHKRKLFVYPKKRRMNTAYADDKLNYVRCCKSTYIEICESYKELWDYYYSTRF